MSKQERDPTALDAVRLLCNAIQKVQHFDREQEGTSPLCRNEGELILQDALEYLAWGDTHNARQVMDVYDTWKATGEAPWPWDANLKHVWSTDILGNGMSDDDISS